MQAKYTPSCASGLRKSQNWETKAKKTCSRKRVGQRKSISCMKSVGNILLAHYNSFGKLGEI
jgi:hypothetical protein